MKKNVMEQEGITLFDVFSTIVRVWKRRTLGNFFANRRIILNLIRTGKRRKQRLRREGLHVPTAIALSPTERCNLKCVGCYSRSHPRESELTEPVISSFLNEAVAHGVGLVVVTGGEPFLRDDMTGFFRQHPEALFLVITNGTVLDESLADELRACGNVMPVISIEGDETYTDKRRGQGVYSHALTAMELLKERNMIFGFSTVCTNTNIEHVGSDDFIRIVTEAGCTLGFYNELIPTHGEDLELIPSAEQAERFRTRLRRHREEKSIILINLPEDEYDADGRCMAVGRGAMHINAQGWVEPCPFAHYARENINTHSFREILDSPFLKAIREHPTVLQHGEIGCSLVSNKAILEEIAEHTGARKTSSAEGILPAQLEGIR